MYSIDVHADAASDLREIAEQNKETAIMLAQFIKQLQADQDLMDRMSQRDYGGSPNRPRPPWALFNANMWRAAQDAGMNLWRMRAFFTEALPYRFIYAYYPPARYVLLAVVEKAAHDDVTDERFDYDLCHPIARRIRRAFDRLADAY